MIKEELKKEFFKFYEKRKSFNEKHRELAEQIDFSRWQTNEYFQYFYEGTKKLSKENTELKEKLGDIQMQKAGEKSDLVWKLKAANEQKAEKLTEAKEILKKYLSIGVGGKITQNYLDVTKQAEQFLKEVEE